MKQISRNILRVVGANRSRWNFCEEVYQKVWVSCIRNVHNASSRRQNYINTLIEKHTLILLQDEKNS